MRTAHLIAGAAQGGAELFYERLIASLLEEGEEILPVIRRDAARAGRLAAAGAVPVQFRFGGALDFWSRPRIRRALRRFAPRTAVAWMGRAASHTPSGPWVLVGRLGGTYALSRFAHCDHLVGNTPGMVAWIAGQGFSAARTHLLPNFAPDMGGSPPAKLPVPEGAPTLLAIGRLHRAKGFDVLLAALARLPGAHAIIAGEGPERVALTDLAAKAGLGGRAHFLGWRSDTAALLAACDVFVCPSRQEPLGNVILEAFAARRPVVAATAEGPAWLLEGGARGILVPVDSAIGLAAAIQSMLDNKAMAARMAQSGRAHYEAHFSREAVTRQWRHFCATVEKP